MNFSHHYSPLHTLLEKSRLLLTLTDVLQQALPCEYRNECSVINYRAETLVLASNNAAFLTLIRLQKEKLLRHFQSRFPTFIFSDIDYKIIPFYGKENPVITPLQPMPNFVKKMIDHLQKKSSSQPIRIS